MNDIPDRLPAARPLAIADDGGAAPTPARSCAAAETHEPYLRRLGERVRNARARRGMTRKILSRDSGVSERYLAQLESGQGNISIALLRQVARAMNMPLADLVRDGPEQPAELSLLVEQLRRLSPAELADAHALLTDRFGHGAGRQGRIALIGLRGAGKSTLGRMLARRRGAPFVQLALEIESEAGMSVSEIFSLSGQAAYRRHERRALERLVERYPDAVIEAGGSIVAEPASYDLLLNTCFTVWVQANPDEHMNRVLRQGDTRPMAGSPEAMEDLRRILSNREALYAKADAIVNTAGRAIEACARELETVCAGVPRPAHGGMAAG